MTQDSTATSQSHPNGRTMRPGLAVRPQRRDSAIFESVFPDSHLGKILKGILTSFLIKQEPRMGWAKRSACDDTVLTAYPNESVAAHQWGVSCCIMAISRLPQFQKEIPNFDRVKALEMALIHDIPELVTGDFTPEDGISAKEKHERESEAMKTILGCFPEPVESSIQNLYTSYETRQCAESKFVKDCDRLDFIIHAFLLERQGFTGFADFYSNTIEQGFHFELVRDLANLLLETRNRLYEEKIL